MISSKYSDKTGTKHYGHFLSENVLNYLNIRIRKIRNTIYLREVA